MMQSSNRRNHLQGKYTLHGYDSLDKYEKVEFLIGFCNPKKSLDLQALSHRLVDEVGEMPVLLTGTAKALLQVEGMYPALAKRFLSYMDFLREYCRYIQLYKPVYIRNVTDMCRHVLPLYRKCTPPCTWQINLTETFELIYEEEILPSRAWGEEDGVEKSLQLAWEVSAKYVIIVQMCGKEWADPKPYDKKHAKLHAERMKEKGYELLDVVLVDEGKIVSMFEEGLINRTGKTKADRQNYQEEQDDIFIVRYPLRPQF